MAEAHGGYSDNPTDPQFRILLAIHEASERRPATIRQICARVDMSVGGVQHHLNTLEGNKLITRNEGARGIRITKAGTDLLLQYDLVALIRMQPVYQITARGFELLERSPKSTSDDA